MRGAVAGPARFMRPDRKSTRLNSSHTVIYTLSLHDALPILRPALLAQGVTLTGTYTGEVLGNARGGRRTGAIYEARSEEHTSELQSHSDLHSFPTRRSSDLASGAPGPRSNLDWHLHRRSAWQCAGRSPDRRDL